MRVHTHICTQIGQTLANCAALWSCMECARMIHWQSACKCIKGLSDMTKYYDIGTVISYCTIEECVLECLALDVMNCYYLFIVLEGAVKKSLYEMVNDVIKFRHSNEYPRRLISAALVLNFFIWRTLPLLMFQYSCHPLLPVGFILWFWRFINQETLSNFHLFLL